MSWSFGFVVAPGGDYEALFNAANAAFHAQQEGYSQPVSAEVDDQIVAAGTAARAIVLSGATGNTSRTVNVTLSGHATPGHAPSAGYAANDYTQVSVIQVT